MTSTCFVSMLGQYLEKFQETAQLLIEARQLGQPAQALEATLQHELRAYTWAVRSRALLLAATSLTEQQQVAELHTRLSVVETLIGLRYGKALPPPTEQTSEPAPPQALLQRLSSAESRLFHLYSVAPLN